MKTFLLAVSAAMAATPARAHSSANEWSPPGPGDVRGPCPGLNTLANHGFLPRDGLDIDADTVSSALTKSLNAEPLLANLFFAGAITTNPAPNATTFSLSDLTRHNILEHDGSLSRQDAHYGRPDLLSPTVFAETLSHFPDPVVNLTQAARARRARIETSNRTNPEFALSPIANRNSLLETAIYLIVFGDRDAASVPKETLVYFFDDAAFYATVKWVKKGRLGHRGMDDVQNERFPPGWERADKAITLDELQHMAGRVANATTSESVSPHDDDKYPATGHAEHDWTDRDDL
ncbi:Cloroperoxidase [Apiospora sp. TS-2023a]